MYIVHLEYFGDQVGWLDVLVPPDFIAENSSSDVITPEGLSIKLLCKYDRRTIYCQLISISLLRLLQQERFRTLNKAQC